MRSGTIACQIGRKRRYPVRSLRGSNKNLLCFCRSIERLRVGDSKSGIFTGHASPLQLGKLAFARGDCTRRRTSTHVQEVFSARDVAAQIIVQVAPEDNVTITLMSGRAVDYPPADIFSRQFHLVILAPGKAVQRVAPGAPDRVETPFTIKCASLSASSLPIMIISNPSTVHSELSHPQTCPLQKGPAWAPLDSAQAFTPQ